MSTRISYFIDSWTEAMLPVTPAPFGDAMSKAATAPTPSTPENPNLKFWGQIFPVTGFGLANGSIKMHIQDGIAPFRCEVKVNGNLYRTIENIPAAEFDYMTYDANGNYADVNCIVPDLPPGSYRITAYDSTPPPEGPQDVRGLADWNAVSPPFATLNGTVDANGVATTVTFEYGLTQPAPGGAYDQVAQFGFVNGTEPVHCSLQLSSGGYNNTSVLIPNTLYHFRIVGVNPNGTSYGEDVTFTTPPPPPPPPPVAVTLPATNVTN